MVVKTWRRSPSRNLFFWFKRNVTPSRQRRGNFITQRSRDAQSIATCNEILMGSVDNASCRLRYLRVFVSPWICPASAVDWSMWVWESGDVRASVDGVDCRRLTMHHNSTALSVSATLSLKQAINLTWTSNVATVATDSLQQQLNIFKPPPPVGAGGGYMFSGRPSVRASVRPSVRDSRGSFMFPRYLQYLQCWRIFAKLLSLVHLGTEMTWLRFWVKRSKFKVTPSRRKRTALDATVECNFSSLYILFSV